MIDKDCKTKGVWIICCDGYYPYCSNCGYEPPWVHKTDMRTPYCPNCGAKMRNEVELNGTRKNI